MKRNLSNYQIDLISYTYTKHMIMPDGDIYSFTEAYDKDRNVIGTMTYADIIYYENVLLLGSKDKIYSMA